VLKVLRWTTSYFQDKGVQEPRASAEVLLAHALGLRRLDLYLRHDQPLTPEELSRFRELVRRRAADEPVAYITGHREFWSLDFQVTPAVLIPRPETEVLVEAVLEAVRESGRLSQSSERGEMPGGNLRGLELGVGAGAVITALARELPDSTWLGLDLSFEALRVARANAHRHGVAARIRFVQGDLFSGGGQPAVCLGAGVANFIEGDQAVRTPCSPVGGSGRLGPAQARGPAGPSLSEARRLAGPGDGPRPGGNHPGLAGRNRRL